MLIIVLSAEITAGDDLSAQFNSFILAFFFRDSRHHVEQEEQVFHAAPTLD
jgi:hypothetical protein